MMKITPNQAEKVHRLVQSLCANCDKDGNCILLDDGEAHRCVQLMFVPVTVLANVVSGL